VGVWASVSRSPPPPLPSLGVLIAVCRSARACPVGEQYMRGRGVS